MAVGITRHITGTAFPRGAYRTDAARCRGRRAGNRTQTGASGARTPLIDQCEGGGGVPSWRAGPSCSVRTEGTGGDLDGEGPAGAGPSGQPGSLGERGHQVCAEPSAALGSEGSSRTTGKLYAWERGEVRCGVMAWLVIVSFPSRWWRQQDSPTRRAQHSGGWLASGGAAYARWAAGTRTVPPADKRAAAASGPPAADARQPSRQLR
jgi:hypothetical protein